MADSVDTGASTGIGFDAVQDAAYGAGEQDQDSSVLTKDEFVEGAVEMGLDEQRAQDIWANSFGDSQAVDRATFDASEIEEEVKVPPATVMPPDDIMRLTTLIQEVIEKQNEEEGSSGVHLSVTV